MIKKWVLKAIVQKTISFLPYKNSINYFFQKYITEGVELNDLHFENKITCARDHTDHLLKHKIANNATCFELGTGWYPVVPLSFYLIGAKQIFTIDLNAHLTKITLLKTFEKYFEWKKNGKLLSYLPQINDERWQQLEQLYMRRNELDLKQLLSELNIVSIVGDARRTDLLRDSVDFLCSNNTFEHIYPNILENILVEFKRILKPNGLMSHFIDMSDHFAHFDNSISVYNFLKFTERQWTLIDNSIQPQNRMRLCQYQKMYKQLEIPFNTNLIRPGDLNVISKIAVKAPYNTYNIKELAISHGYMLTNFSN